MTTMYFFLLSADKCRTQTVFTLLAFDRVQKTDTCELTLAILRNVPFMTNICLSLIYTLVYWIQDYNCSEYTQCDWRRY